MAQIQNILSRQKSQPPAVSAGSITKGVHIHTLPTHLVVFQDVYDVSN